MQIVTTFLSETISLEMFEWLQSSGAHFDISGGETEMSPITYDGGKTQSFIAGMKNQ